MHHSRACMFLAAAISIGATACSSSEPDVKTALRDPNVVAKLREMAVEAAGESTPTSMYAVAVSDHQAAEAALGSGVYDHSPVYVIVITGGHFTARGGPLGATPPEGSVLTLTVDATSYDVTDVGIGDVEPDLSKVALASIDLSAS
jgi:hypothetical protein